MNALYVKNCPKCQRCKAQVYGFHLSDGRAVLCLDCSLAKTKEVLQRRFENDVIDNPERAFREFKKQKAREALRKMGYRI